MVLLPISTLRPGTLGDVTYPVTGPVIGVIGGGQLARMMAPAATNLGLNLRILAGIHRRRRGSVTYRPRRGLLGFGHPPRAYFHAARDVITFDHEHVPTDFLHTPSWRGRKCTTPPGGSALRTG